MKYRPPLGLSQPLDRSCAVEINLAYSCSLQAVPFVFLSRRAARRSVHGDDALQRGEHYRLAITARMISRRRQAKE